MDCGDGQGDIGQILTFGCQIESERGPLRRHGCDHRWNAYDVHDAGHVVGEDMQRHLGGDVFQPPHLEVGGTHP